MPYLCPKLPLARSVKDPGGIGMIQDYPTLVDQNLKNLVLTNPGERVMDMNFGVGLKTFLFLPNTGVTHEMISSRILAQINRYMPFVEVNDILYNTKQDDPDDIGGNYVDMIIMYRIKPLSVNGVLSITDSLILASN